MLTIVLQSYMMIMKIIHDNLPPMQNMWMRRFQTIVSDFTKEFSTFKEYFSRSVGAAKDRLEVDLADLFIKQKAINTKNGAGTANAAMMELLYASAMIFDRISTLLRSTNYS